MSEQWVSASQAVELVGGDFTGVLALCTRAHAGLVKTKAALYLRNTERRENVVLPAAFWFAEGREALEQNWATGDFSTWVDRRVHHRAFGVTFGLNGLLEMMPATERPKVSRMLSVSGSDQWLRALDARRYLYEHGRIGPLAAGSVLIQQSALGFLSARAVKMSMGEGERPEEWTSEEREWDVPVWFWENFTVNGSSSQKWDEGRFSGRGSGPNGFCWITLEDVRFLTQPLKVFADPSPEVQKPESVIPKGGRPPKAFWDELWCAIWGDIYRGDLKPSRQSDIQSAMLDWAVKNDEELSETVAKGAARKLFDQLQREVGN